MAISTVDVTRELISYSVVNDKDSIVKLLKRNGIDMPQNPSDQEVTVAVLLASSKNENFKKEFAQYLASKINEAAESTASFVGDSTDFGFTGIDDFMFTGSDDYQYIFGLGKKDPTKSAAKAASKATKATAKAAAREARGGKTRVGSAISSIFNFAKENVLTQENLNTGIQFGLTNITNKQQAKTNALQQEANVLAEQQDELRKSAAATTSKGLSTGAMIGIGVGIVALGAILYFAMKKK